MSAHQLMCQAMVISAFRSDPKAVAVVVAWSQGYIVESEPRSLSAYTCHSHLDAALLLGESMQYSAVYTRDSFIRKG